MMVIINTAENVQVTMTVIWSCWLYIGWLLEEGDLRRSPSFIFEQQPLIIKAQISTEIIKVDKLLNFLFIDDQIVRCSL